MTEVPGNGRRRDLTGRIGDRRPTLAVVEAIALESRADPYLSLASLAAYSSCSIRWLRDRLRDPHHPLPYYRLPGGKIRVRRSAFDTWLDHYRRVGHPDVDRVVADVLGGLR